MEVIDIDFNDIPTGDVPASQDDSVNFGTGIELLMNDKKKTGSTKVDLGELDNVPSFFKGINLLPLKTFPTTDPSTISPTLKLCLPPALPLLLVLPIAFLKTGYAI